MSKRKRYTDEFRASAVVALRVAGYPNVKGALERTAQNLGIPAMTLLRWAKGQSNPPPNEIVTEKKGQISDLIRQEIYGILGEMETKRQSARYSELATALGIAIDKLQILTDQPTENAKQSIVIRYERFSPDPA